MDDIITGADSLQEALLLQNELINLLKTAGLELRKWTSNHPAILNSIPAEYREFSFSYEKTDSVKILGLIWNPSEDYFTYKINLPDHASTKRTILSDIARIFDPVGWLSPIIMVTKSYFTELQKFVTSTDHNQHLANQLASDGIQWHLNPPSAPHFGGLWDAGIKSVKLHLSRVIGSQLLTFEEFSTLLCQIESILNSRPLCPLSSNPNDLHSLTPNHFLLLEPAVWLPDRDYVQEPDHHLTRWQLLQRTQQDFWKRWHQEYINTLQQRTKWTRSTPNLEPNQLVLIRNELLPPLQWKLSRILAVHPGRDGVVRVAQVKTASGVLCRPVVKLCPLPHT